MGCAGPARRRPALPSCGPGSTRAPFIQHPHTRLQGPRRFALASVRAEMNPRTPPHAANISDVNCPPLASNSTPVHPTVLRPDWR
jgi:hypothetical protein